MSAFARTATVILDPAILYAISAEFPEAGEGDTPEVVEAAFEKMLRHVNAVEVDVNIQGSSVIVQWSSDLDDRECAQQTLSLLEKGRVNEAAILMEILLGSDTHNATMLCNLGMVYSDAGFLERAVKLLLMAVEADPEHDDGFVALGVAYTRSDDLDNARKYLLKAIDINANNPWAFRNLGVVYLRQEDSSAAAEVLSRATELSPNDDRAWFGLAQALELIGEISRADDAYQRVVSINEYGDIAETARQARSKIAASTFRGKGDVRMDAAMYLLSALEEFQSLDNEEVQKIGFEIAMLGTKGININDPESSYSLSSLPGTYSGLSLVCHQYVAFKRFAPQMDIGIDLSKEYEAAQEMLRLR